MLTQRKPHNDLHVKIIKFSFFRNVAGRLAYACTIWKLT